MAKPSMQEIAKHRLMTKKQHVGLPKDYHQTTDTGDNTENLRKYVSFDTELLHKLTEPPPRRGLIDSEEYAKSKLAEPPPRRGLISSSKPYETSEEEEEAGQSLMSGQTRVK